VTHEARTTTIEGREELHSSWMLTSRRKRKNLSALTDLYKSFVELRLTCFCLETSALSQLEFVLASLGSLTIPTSVTSKSRKRIVTEEGMISDP
jgi:hypothetical protein